jgi:3',5'-cyclic AMP phosphodiesterase CpdA
MLIAQMSDIHASAENDNLARLGRAISWLASIQPDVVVLTGDLVEGNWPEGYKLITAALQRLKCRSLILPGNSDERATMREAMPEVNYWVNKPEMHFAEPHGEALIIGLDVCVDGKTYGDVAGSLQWLQRTLAGDLPGFPLLFTHHHVFRCGIAPIDDVMCRGANALGGILSSSGRPPVAICSGHVHRGMSSLLAKIPAHICGSICPANPLLLDPSRQPPATDPPALLIHDLRNGQLVSSHISV